MASANPQIKLSKIQITSIWFALTFPNKAPKVINTAPAPKSPTTKLVISNWIFSQCPENTQCQNPTDKILNYTAIAATNIFKDTDVQLWDFKNAIKNPKPTNIMMWMS